MELNVNLPDAVRSRLEDVQKPGVAMPVKATRGVEEERVRKVEFRVADDGTVEIEGYATVWDTPYDVAGGAPYGWSEVISRGAADKALAERDDTRLLVNHDGIPLARTKSGTLTLEADPVGLLTRARLDPKNPTVAELRSAMERGDIDEMSFAFRATRQEWNDDYTERRITEVRLFDVSVVTYPANPATHVQLRGDDTPVVTRAAMPLGLARSTADALRARRVA